MARNRNYQMLKRWNIADETKLFETTVFSADFARLLASRGISTETDAENYINPKYSELANPLDIPDMDRAVTTILAAIKSGDKIAIYGDYDVDGVTATAILADFFSKIEVEAVTYIPSRVDEGYGLNTEAIKNLSKQDIKLVITVDCGSTSLDVVAAANKIGVNIVVTDHHVLKLENGKTKLPAAAAVVNPKRLMPEHPLYELAGAAVAFYLVRALQTHFTEQFAPGQEKWLLDLVAMGTICDVVPLAGENRILAKYGLNVLSKSRRVGIQSLAQISEVNLEFVDSYKVGFLLGPRLNAAGRIEHARSALSLLLSKDKEEADKLSAELNELNLQRQEITESIVTEAREIIEQSDKSQKIYLLSGKDWPSGVVGIVASRLADEYGKPMLVMEDMGGELKGSARSIKNFNIIEALSSCDELLSRFGGHAYAAGFSLDKDNLENFSKKLIQIADAQISDTDLEPEICIDLRISAENVNQGFIEELSLLEPFGRGNTKPLFLLEAAKIAEAKLVGSPAVHLKLKLQQGSTLLSGIAFGYGEKMDLETAHRYDFVVTLEINEWNNRKSPEFRLIDLRKA
jgi:single-stranded-DNA-specific exonuclease